MSKGFMPTSKLSCVVFLLVFSSVVFLVLLLWSRSHEEQNHREVVLQKKNTALSLAQDLAIKSLNSLSSSVENIPSTQSPSHKYQPASGFDIKQHSSVKWDPINDNFSVNTTAMSCKVSFPPKCDMYPYVRFWNKRFFPADCQQSPLRPLTKEKTPYDQMKYVVFEPDRGGWNNIRMAAETAIIFALYSGRTLVLPAPGYWYLLTQSKDHGDNLSTFAKFYDLSKVHELLTIMPMVDFLNNVAKKPGLLKVPLPSDTNVEAILKPREKLCSYFEKAAYIEEWEPGKQFIAFNLSSQYPGGIGTFDMKGLAQDKRYKEMVAHGRKLRPYDAQLHAERVIYFPGDYRNKYRLLTHFYTYHFWTDMQEAKRVKRIVRDRLHYHDDIFCAAGYVVRLLHEEAAVLTGKAVPTLEHADHKTLGGNTNLDATYFAFHIRRGDFQYKETRISAEELWQNIGDKLDSRVTRLIYIATDEKDKTFFDPIKHHGSGDGFHLRYFQDYEAALRKRFPSFNVNMIGMVEQVICANAHTFFGTPRSSFTGYITRMRGYYRDGRYQRTYYTLKKDMFALQKKRDLIGPFWAREFEIAHRNADDYYQETPESSQTVGEPLTSDPPRTIVERDSRGTRGSKPPTIVKARKILSPSHSPESSSGSLHLRTQQESRTSKATTSIPHEKNPPASTFHPH